MSVLINGIDMPKDCSECLFELFDDEEEVFSCEVAKRQYAYKELAKMMKRCPLVEVKTPHSRLIEEKIVRDIIDRMAFNTEVHAYTLALFTEHLNHDYDFGTVIESEE